MTDVLNLKNFESLSPFEIKDELIKLAKETSRRTQSAFLNAGRGNPNWVATTPRDAFFLLGQFAMSESRRVMSHPAGLGGMPQAAGIAGRLDAWLERHSDLPGASFLAAMVPFAVKAFAFDPDAFVHELVDSIVGDNYPVPDRMLVHNERIVHEYLIWAMCGKRAPAGRFDLYAVEGGTAAMCYLFKSLKANRLLLPGDTIALGTPIFTPYLEMTHLEDYALNVVHIKAPQENKFQYTDAEIDKLLDPKVKAFFVVNPGNPTGMAMSAETIAKITELVKSKRPDLMILTDDVYGTFVHDFRSLMAELPHNTIGVYSFSKYFGCTGWRLGAIAIHEDNIFDKMIAKLPADVTADLDRRYGPLTLEPRKLKFIDRIVADSRDIALNHTAGLSLPQQVMMSLFSLSELMDDKKAYQEACMEIVNRRVWSMIEGLGLHLTPNPNFDAYYGLIDFEFWARKNIGEEAVEYLKRTVHPLDLAFRLAEVHGIVLLNGGGFEAPDWSLRVSLANLPDEVYADIGRGVRAVARGYRDAYEAAKRASGAEATKDVEPVPAE
ncbi:bifunctional aspartate transaminase/aspartate 4-decarboxylase [Methylobacterium sp. CB376]|uniref:bifunctional aspartate transaminase/aspartate 4-decarboxylase n=1 Tax=unclassified Methylobacterium TaxID=2615210 RepID=UPI000152D436|nr:MULTISPECIES: bifunctional aspartate transaminase/aspartate 4-decarboxylase [Methylobacterium]WFT81770.1 bifunctional aspartate transaminase/aspartate 4-decarboxylase [Methylobacterium nodulans]